MDGATPLHQSEPDWDLLLAVKNVKGLPVLVSGSQGAPLVGPRISSLEFAKHCEHGCTGGILYRLRAVCLPDKHSPARQPDLGAASLPEAGALCQALVSTPLRHLIPVGLATEGKTRLTSPALQGVGKLLLRAVYDMADEEERQDVTVSTSF